MQHSSLFVFYVTTKWNYWLHLRFDSILENFEYGSSIIICKNDSFSTFFLSKLTSIIKLIFRRTDRDRKRKREEKEREKERMRMYAQNAILTCVINIMLLQINTNISSLPKGIIRVSILMYILKFDLFKWLVAWEAKIYIAVRNIYIDDWLFSETMCFHIKLFTRK